MLPSHIIVSLTYVRHVYSSSLLYFVRILNDHGHHDDDRDEGFATYHRHHFGEIETLGYN